MRLSRQISLDLSIPNRFYGQLNFLETIQQSEIIYKFSLDSIYKLQSFGIYTTHGRLDARNRMLL